MIRNTSIHLRKLLKSNFIKKHFEIPLINKHPDSSFVPIFIVGAPRSGTTLVYQALANQIDFSFFTNWVNIFPSSPVFASIKLSGKLGNSDLNYFKSNYGLINGINSPSEAGFIFREWFDTSSKESVNSEIIRKFFTHSLVNLVVVFITIYNNTFIN